MQLNSNINESSDNPVSSKILVVDKNFEELSVNQLKDQCRLRNASVKGIKSDLIQR